MESAGDCSNQANYKKKKLQAEIDALQKVTTNMDIEISKIKAQID